MSESTEPTPDSDAPVVFGSITDPHDEATATSDTNEEVAAKLLPLLRAAALPATVDELQQALIDSAQSLSGQDGAVVHAYVPLGRLEAILKNMTEASPPTVMATPLGDPPQRLHYMAAKMSPMAEATTARAAVINAVADLSEIEGDSDAPPKNEPGMTLAELTARLVATVDADVIETDVAVHVTALVVANKLVINGTGAAAIIDIAPGVLTAIVEAGALAVAAGTMPIVETTKVNPGDRSGFERKLSEELNKERERFASATRERDALRSWMRDYNISDADIDGIMAPAKGVIRKASDQQPLTEPGQEKKTFLWTKMIPVDAELRAKLGDEYIRADRDIKLEDAKLAMATGALKEAKVNHEKNCSRLNGRKEQIDQARHDATYLMERMAFKTADFASGEEVICDAETGEELERKPLTKRVQGTLLGLEAVTLASSAPAGANVPSEGGKAAKGAKKGKTKETVKAEPVVAEVPQGRGDEDLDDENETEDEPPIALRPPSVPPKGKPKATEAKVAGFVEPVFDMVTFRGVVLMSDIAATYAEEAKLVVSPNVAKMIKTAAEQLVKDGRLKLEGDALTAVTEE
jgi:hypothetical protein